MTKFNTRVPVEISTTSVIENGSVVYLTNVICGDGTIWELTDVAEGWKRLPDIPQDIEDENPDEVERCNGNCEQCDCELSGSPDLNDESLQQLLTFIDKVFGAKFVK